MLYSFFNRFILQKVPDIQKNLQLKMKAADEKIKSIEVSYQKKYWSMKEEYMM